MIRNPSGTPGSLLMKHMCTTGTDTHTHKHAHAHTHTHIPFVRLVYALSMTIVHYLGLAH